MKSLFRDIMDSHIIAYYNQNRRILQQLFLDRITQNNTTVYPFTRLYNF